MYFYIFSKFYFYFDTKINHFKYFWYNRCFNRKLFSHISKKKKNIGSFGSLIKISTREVLFKYKKLRKKKSKAIVILLKYKFTKPDGSFIKFYKNTCVLLKRRIVPTATFVIGCCPYNLRRKKFLTSFKVII